VCQLDQYGYPVTGNPTYTTDQLVKATFAPVMETGDDLVQKNANGDIIWHFKHGDMPKYWNVSLDMATPDPTLEYIINGGTLLNDTLVAITAPTTAPTGTAAGGGSLAAGSYFYAYSYGNQYGETTLSTVSSAITATAAQQITLTLVAGAGGITQPYMRIYRGTTSSNLQLLATVPNGTTYVDTGAVVPSGNPPTSNTSGGPSLASTAPAYGYAPPTLGVVGNPNGFSLELWSKAVVKSVQATYLPYYRWAIPLVRNAVPETRTVTDAGLENVYAGQAFENPNWGQGPFGDFQATTSQVFTRIRASQLTVPTVGFANTPATA
jgi:hypothetical protein